MSWSRGGLTGLICRDNSGAHGRPLGSSSVEHRPDGATTQEVYNMAKNLFNHQTSSEELGGTASSRPEDEDKCLDKGARPDPHLRDGNH